MNATMRPTVRAALLLAAFAAGASTLLAGSYALTKDQIAASTQARLLRELSAVLPPDRYDNALASDTLTLDDRALGGASTVYRARSGDEVVAAIFTVVAPDGYSGPIQLLVGVDRSGALTGVRATQHRETPGLGDKIDTRKDRWILGFEGRSLRDPERAQWAVKKDQGVFDQFTGATITPRAVVAAIASTLEFAAEHHAMLFDTTEVDEATPALARPEEAS